MIRGCISHLIANLDTLPEFTYLPQDGLTGLGRQDRDQRRCLAQLLRTAGASQHLAPGTRLQNVLPLTPQGGRANISRRQPALERFQHGLDRLAELLGPQIEGSLYQGQAVFGQVLALARPYQAALWNALSVPERESLAAIMDKLAAAAGQLDEQAMREGAAVKGRRLGLGRKMRGAAGQDA